MPTTNANTILYATRMARYPAINLPSGTAANTITLLVTGDAAGTIVTDVLFRNAQATVVNFDIILCATGSQAVAENARVQTQIAANSGNNGTSVIASLASLQAPLFDIDLAGNRVINVESGQSLYVRNTALTTATIFITVKARDFAV